MRFRVNIAGRNCPEVTLDLRKIADGLFDKLTARPNRVDALAEFNVMPADKQFDYTGASDIFPAQFMAKVSNQQSKPVLIKRDGPKYALFRMGNRGLYLKASISGNGQLDVVPMWSVLGGNYIQRTNLYLNQTEAARGDIDFNLAAGEGTRFIGFPALNASIHAQPYIPVVNLEFDVKRYTTALDWVDRKIGLKSP